MISSAIISKLVVLENLYFPLVTTGQGLYSIQYVCCLRHWYGKQLVVYFRVSIARARSGVPQVVVYSGDICQRDMTSRNWWPCKIWSIYLYIDKICYYHILLMNSFGMLPHPATVTTRIVTFIARIPYEPSFAIITGRTSQCVNVTIYFGFDWLFQRSD